ncbi:MAG: S8 family peptidase [Ignavibacteria bacterium]|nr:S8 family peptidase [Ignavibacteria bacterium]
MIRKSLLVAVLTVISLFAQPVEKASPGLKNLMESTPNNQTVSAWITFTDKPQILTKLGPGTIVSEKSLERRKKYLPEDKLIDFTDIPVNPDYILQVEASGAKIRHILKWFNAVSVEATPQALQKIASSPSVKSLDIINKFRKNYELESKNYTTKSTPTASPAATHSLNYGNSLTQANIVNLPAVHDLGLHGEGIIIGVFDAGFNNLPHEAFAQMQIIARWDFVNHNSGVGDSTDLGVGTHGTHTLSIIGGYMPGKLIGPAYKAKYILAKTENTASETPIEEDNWIAAMQWADSIGVDVTSTSLGYLEFDPPYTSYTWQSMDGKTCRITIAADLAVKKGINVFVSAGNEGTNATHNTLGAPADGDSVVTIGAVDETGVRSSFSSVGNTVDGRVKPDVMAMGSYVEYASAYYPNTYEYGDGTSYSCPMAAGIGALILQFRPDLSPIQIRNILRSTASRSSNPGREYGWGIINAYQAVSQAFLPVNLQGLSLKRSGKSITISWSTGTEKNDSGFEVQKSFDGSSWITMGFVKGAGTSLERHSYSFTDNLVNGDAYYRLKLIDNSGKFVFSETIQSQFHVTSFALNQNYPNPFNPATTITYTLPEAGNTVLKVYSSTGQLVKTLVNEFQYAGPYEVQFNAVGLASGNYYYQLEYKGNILTRHMLSLK